MSTSLKIHCKKKFGYFYFKNRGLAITHPRFLPTHAAAKLHVHGDGAYGKFNMKLAMLVTRCVGSMNAAYLFAAIAVVSLPLAILSGDLLVIIAWLAQTFLQLVLLPVILVGQNVSAVASDARALATYTDGSEVLRRLTSLESRLIEHGVIGAES